MSLFSELPRIIRITLGAIALTVFFLAQSGALDGVGKAFGGAQIEAENLSYLQDARDAAADDFITLTEVLAVLKIIDSAEVGFDFFVSANVQVGQGLAGLTSAVERALEVTAVSAASAEGLIALGNIASFVTPPLFSLLMLVLAIYLMVSAISRLHTVARLLRTLTEIAAVLFLAAHLMVPYSIHLSGWVATNAVSALTEEARGKVSTLNQEVTGTSTSSNSFDGWSKDDQVKSGFERAVNDLPHKVDTIGLYLVRQLASAVVLGIVFPLGLLLIFFAGARRLVRYAALALESDWNEVKSSSGQAQESARS